MEVLCLCVCVCYVRTRGLSTPTHTHTHPSLVTNSPHTVYNKLKGDQAIIQILVYILANLVGIGVGLYKFHNMGLLPTAQSDWLEFMEERQVGVVTLQLSKH